MAGRERQARLNRFAAPNSAKELNSISMPTMAVTSVTDAAGPEPISIRAMIKSSTPITNCSQLPGSPRRIVARRPRDATEREQHGEVHRQRQNARQRAGDEHIADNQVGRPAKCRRSSAGILRPVSDHGDNQPGAAQQQQDADHDAQRCAGGERIDQHSIPPASSRKAMISRVVRCF